MNFGNKLEKYPGVSKLSKIQYKIKYYRNVIEKNHAMSDIFDNLKRHFNLKLNIYICEKQSMKFCCAAKHIEAAPDN